MRHLLSINDLSKADITEVFRLAKEAKAGNLRGIMEDKTLALLFEKKSTRTRVSFESAMLRLKGSSIYLDGQTMQVSRGETYADTAKMLSLYVHFIAARLYDHKALIEMANASSVPVINALTDLEHPCQALSDIYTIIEIKGGISGKKIAFMGDLGDNVLNSLMLVGTKLGAKIALIGPKESKPNPDYLKIARKQGEVEVFSDVKRGLAGADVVYTDTWVSMGQEKDAERRKKLFAPYQLNRKALSHANKDAIVMHCLPAHRGEEITSDVLDGKRSVVLQEAENKMFVQAGILAFLDTAE